MPSRRASAFLRLRGELSYDGGTESFELDKITYTLTDDYKLLASISVGLPYDDIVDEMKQLEFNLNQVKNY